MTQMSTTSTTKTTKMADVPDSPVNNLRWVSVKRVRANDYNPNSVSPPEMRLLKLSILKDGYTQPVVTVQDGDNFVVVDGFHRYSLCRDDAEVNERFNGMVPIVVIDASVEDRMASTVRHNRARGRHGVTGMSGLVTSMLAEGLSDEAICNELGMEPQELIRLKHITGYAKLFADFEFSREVRSYRQNEIRRAWNEGNPDDRATV